MTTITVNDAIVEIRIADARLDAAAAPGLKLSLDEGLPTGINKIVLDLGAVAFMDSTGLGVLVTLLKRLGPTGAMAVAAAQPAVRRLFELTRLDTLFHLSPDLAAARAAVDG